MRRTQLYLEEAQYRWLKSQAGKRGSIAEVVRGLINAAQARRPDASLDPLIRHLLAEPAGAASEPTTVETLDEDIYDR